MFQRLRTAIRTKDNIEFLCHKDDVGVIPEPIEARKVLPEWFKKLPPKIEKGKLESSTIKRCMPVLDAMNLGFIIPLAADVEIVTNSGATDLAWKTKFHREIIQTHAPDQVKGHPNLPMPPLKWLNWWAIKLPRGYSMLFMPPLNRVDTRFQCFSGMVDDTYMGTGALEFINFPFFFTQPNYTGIIKAGTPLVQCIPFKRGETMGLDHSINALADADLQLIDHTRRRRGVSESLYKDTLRQPK